MLWCDEEEEEEEEDGVCVPWLCGLMCVCRLCVFVFARI